MAKRKAAKPTKAKATKIPGVGPTPKPPAQPTHPPRAKTPKGKVKPGTWTV